MRKWIALMVSILLVFGIAACGNTPAPGDGLSGTGDGSLAQTSSGTAGEPEVPEESGKKILVVDYSATGHTQTVARHIAAATGADLFELVPADPYTEDDLNYNDDGSRVVYEHEHPEDRAVELVSVTPENWESYDTVFIGYPIWWQIAAWPVDGFVEGNDFTGKTVIPFATSASSGLGESGALLAELAGTGNWQQGRRFSSYAGEATVTDWLHSLGF